MKTYIIGHTKPDTDAVVAAMGLEHLYRNAPDFGYSDAHALIADPLNPETSFIFKKFGVSAPTLLNDAALTDDDQFVLVDHNESSQRPEHVTETSVVEVVDHHKVNMDHGTPIYLTFKPWGSSSTIVYYLMKQAGVQPTKELAALMLCAILSDTVGFKSATTTDRDKQLGSELATIAGVENVEALTLEIFKAKSDISSLSDEAIVKNDYKVFDFAQKTFIGQLETVEQTRLVTDKKQDLLTAMQAIKESEGVDLLFLALTDILTVNTKLLILGDAEKAVAEKAFGGTVSDSVLDIGPKMSRKKEIAPAIEEAEK